MVKPVEAGEVALHLRRREGERKVAGCFVQKRCVEMCVCR